MTLNDFLGIVDELSKLGFKFVVIGSAVPSLFLKERIIGSDIDVYALSPDPLFEEEKYFEIADKKGWEVERTWAGTPSFYVQSGFNIDFYTNIMEFELPPVFLEETKTWRIKGVSLRSVGLEESLLLKARAVLVDERHLRALGEWSDRLRGRVDRDRVFSLLEEFSEDTRPVMERILNRAFPSS